jgi:hypothetical protein
MAPLASARFGFAGGGAVPLEGTFFAVAGGGGAGGNEPRSAPLTMPGGGGGAGGFLSDNDSGIELATFDTGTTYAISTGAGGSGGGGNPGSPGTVGSDTTWNDATNGTLTLKGGGRGGGGSQAGTEPFGGTGGSAGGTGSRRGTTRTAALVLSPMQGTDGGASDDYFQSAGGGGKSSGGGNSAGGGNPGAGGNGYTWVDGVERAIGGCGSDRQNNFQGGGATSVTDGTGNGGASRYQSHFSGLRGSNGGCGIRFPDAYTISNPGGGLTITTTTASGLTTAIITGTGNIQFD